MTDPRTPRTLATACQLPSSILPRVIFTVSLIIFPHPLRLLSSQNAWQCHVGSPRYTDVRCLFPVTWYVQTRLRVLLPLRLPPKSVSDTCIWRPLHFHKPLFPFTGPSMCVRLFSYCSEGAAKAPPSYFLHLLYPSTGVTLGSREWVDTQKCARFAVLEKKSLKSYSEKPLLS